MIDKDLEDQDQAPVVSGADTIDALVAASKRRKDFFYRREFLQIEEDGDPSPGPLAALVGAGDRRALLLYLLLLTKASAAPWDASLPAAAWARALDLPLPESKAARSTVSKAWMRLERLELIRRTRRNRWAAIHLLREDGSGLPYTQPGDDGDRYVRMPLALWQKGPDQSTRWYQVLSLPELAVLLIGRSLRDGFWLPFERGPEWYGISPDTLGRGVKGLRDYGLIDTVKRFKKAPLSAVGYTAEHRYTLEPPFGPMAPRPKKLRPRKAT